MRTGADYCMAFDIGVKDGLESPHDLSMGMTWEDDQGMNEEYDKGVNLGQEIGVARETGFWSDGKPYVQGEEP